jgi:hypothetical protein
MMWVHKCAILTVLILCFSVVHIWLLSLLQVFSCPPLLRCEFIELIVKFAFKGGLHPYFNGALCYIKMDEADGALQYRCAPFITCKIIEDLRLFWIALFTIFFMGFAG